MNAERLHVIAKTLRSEFRELEIVEHLQGIREALERLLQNPQQTQFQQQISDRLTTLQKRLVKAPSNSFSPAWRQIVEEIGRALLVTRLPNAYEASSNATRLHKQPHWGKLNKSTTKPLALRMP